MTKGEQHFLNLHQEGELDIDIECGTITMCCLRPLRSALNERTGEVGWYCRGCGGWIDTLGGIDGESEENDKRVD